MTASAPSVHPRSEPGSRTLEVRRLGSVPYAEGLAIQADLVARRRAGEIPDTLLLLEHPHVVTMGTGASEANIVASDEEREALGIELFQTGRGGDVTYHGPGQLVGYPILALEGDRRDLHRYLRDLEQVLIDTLATFDIIADRAEGLTGAWVEDRKLAAIGVRVSSGWITSHGFALNVNTDLSYFGAIVPCGITDRNVGSIAAELGRPVPMEEVMVRIEGAFRRIFAFTGP